MSAVRTELRRKDTKDSVRTKCLLVKHETLPCDTDPLSGLLQVAPQNLSDLLLATLGDARDRSSSGCSSRLNVSVETHSI